MLKDFGINLSGQFENQVFNSMPQYRGNYPLLYNGILCANQESKGKVLETFIYNNNLSPDQIFFIDDSLQNLKEVQKACKRMNIPCHLFHFNRFHFLGMVTSLEPTMEENESGEDGVEAITKMLLAMEKEGNANERRKLSLKIIERLGKIY